MTKKVLSSELSYFLWQNQIYNYAQLFKSNYSTIGFTNIFHATNLFHFPLKTLGKQRFSDIFREYRKRPMA